MSFEWRHNRDRTRAGHELLRTYRAPIGHWPFPLCIATPFSRCRLGSPGSARRFEGWSAGPGKHDGTWRFSRLPFCLDEPDGSAGIEFARAAKRPVRRYGESVVHESGRKAASEWIKLALHQSES